MEQNTIYLDTSVLNFFFEEADLEKSSSTRKLFREILGGKYSAFISELVLREVGKA
jgi:predicted nucleic acid-binding protein